MAKTELSVEDMVFLEENEQLHLMNNRTRHAMHDTYGPKSPTKKRRKLPGNRTWKNKSQGYAVQMGRMKAKEFNSDQKRDEIVKDYYKKQQRAFIKQQKKLKKHSLI